MGKIQPAVYVPFLAYFVLCSSSSLLSSFHSHTAARERSNYQKRFMKKMDHPKANDQATFKKHFLFSFASFIRLSSLSSIHYVFAPLMSSRHDGAGPLGIFSKTKTAILLLFARSQPFNHAFLLLLLLPLIPCQMSEKHTHMHTRTYKLDV